APGDAVLSGPPDEPVVYEHVTLTRSVPVMPQFGSRDHLRFDYPVSGRARPHAAVRAAPPAQLRDEVIGGWCTAFASAVQAGEQRGQVGGALAGHGRRNPVRPG